MEWITSSELSPIDSEREDILADAHAEASRIISEARAEARRVLEEETLHARILGHQMLLRARDEAERERRRLARGAPSINGASGHDTIADPPDDEPAQEREHADQADQRQRR
jgi:cell division septum initiation protein DivIVA